MELRHLRYFVAVAEEGNFNRAALRLRVAQPALSRQVHALECELGAQLFERLPRGVKLTPAGAALLTDAAAILSDVDIATQNVKRIAAAAAGFLRIGANEIALSDPAVAETTRRLRRERPGIGLEFSPMASSAQTVAILTDRLDAGFLYLETPSQGLDGLQVRDYTLLAGLPADHRLAAQPTIRTEDLRAECFVWTPPGALSFVHDKLLQMLRGRGIDVDIVQHANGTDCTLDMIAAGLGVGFVHSSARERRRPDVVLREISDLQLSLPLSFVWRRGWASAALESFTQMLRETLVAEAEGVADGRAAATRG